MLDYFVGSNGLDQGQILIAVLAGLGATVGLVVTVVAGIAIGLGGGGADHDPGLGHRSDQEG